MNNIKIGTFDFDVIKVGSSNVDAVYVGSTKVYPHGYSHNYLTFTATNSGTFKFSGNSISYSLDSGSTWTTLPSGTDSPTVQNGSKIMWKASGLTPTSGSGIGTFSSTANFTVEGNVMSLYYGDNFVGETSLADKSYAFRGLFGACSGLTSAENIVLPATTLETSCYNRMFYGCSNLTTVPNDLLPAETMAESCYSSMFSGCTSLTTAPQLQSTSLAKRCYYEMFYRCTSLTTAPDLPATTVNNECYFSMFLGCTSLTNVPSTLPATNLSGANQCYTNMFSRCTSLTTAPSLPATTLSNGCYYNMFYSGTSLTTAPELPATTLLQDSYRQMFYYCNRLSYIKCLATDKSASNCTTNWVTNVASAGTFVKDTSMTGWTSGTSGIPSGWAVYNHPYQVQYFTIRSMADDNTIKLYNNMSATTTNFSYSLDSGTTWTDFTLAKQTNRTIATIDSGETIMMKGENNTLGDSYNAGHYFRGSKDYTIEGAISSLVNGNNLNLELGDAANRSYTFAQLFSGDTHLINAEDLVISSISLPDSCFNCTFRGCTSLVAAPELPSTILGDHCYSSMFEYDTALARPPKELRFTTAKTKEIYTRMFSMNRTSSVQAAMTETPKLFGDWGALDAKNEQMFCGNANLNKVYCYWTKTNHNFDGYNTNWMSYTTNGGTFYKRSTETFSRNVSGVPTGWTIVNDDITV